MPKMYDELAVWWPLLSSPTTYAEEATFYLAALSAACDRPPRAILELGSGGGNTASHLKAHASLVLVDLSPAMLAVSAALNPECEHIAGDMRGVRLDRLFDAVFVHDAICYMTSEEELRQAMETAFVHCRPGGGVLFAPDYVRETFHSGTEHGGDDGSGRAMRYLEWVWDPNPDDTTYVADYVFALREADGSIRVEHDRHIEGLFSRATWLRLLTDAGFEHARSLPFEHSELEPGSHEVFVATRPTG